MAVRFCFFTDPELLTTQTPGQAFGPSPTTTAGKNQFRVTDLHSSTTSAPVVAICDGLVCAQKDGQGTLTLILKPARRPPFDFPAISYFLYKGVDPDSILTSDGEHIETSSLQLAENDLANAINTAWKLPANNNTGEPTKACLGLHLTSSDYPVVADRPKFASDQPLDRLFYEGDPDIQLPLVQPGWRLGDFSSTFGLEIVVERIRSRPMIALARTRDTMIEVDVLPSGADESAAFLHWDAKEHVLDFVDPCAFWGSFFASTLRAWDTVDDELYNVSGEDVYTDVVDGTEGNFFNRNRAYLDIRNEHGCSINYYRAEGPHLQLTLDPAADIDSVAMVDYYARGWPVFTIDDTLLPSGSSGDRIDVRFALPKTINTLPLIYVSAGFRGAFRRLKDAERFIERPRRADSWYLEEASITIPLVHDGATTHVGSSYHKLCFFKRPLVVEGQTIPAPGSNHLYPAYTNDLDHFMPVLAPQRLPASSTSMILKTYDESFYVGSGVTGGPAFVGNAALGVDAQNAVLMLVPRVHKMPRNRKRPPPLAFPSLAFPKEAASIFAYISSLLPSPLLMRKVPNPLSTSTDMELLYYRAPAPLSQNGLTRLRPLIILAMSRAEAAQVHTTLSTAAPLLGPTVLSLEIGSTYGQASGAYIGIDVNVSTVSGQTPVTRTSGPASVHLYADAG